MPRRHFPWCMPTQKWPAARENLSLIVKWAWSSFMFPLGMRSKFLERPPRALYFHAILFDTERPTFFVGNFGFSAAALVSYALNNTKASGRFCDGLKKHSRWRGPTKANLSLPRYLNLRSENLRKKKWNRCERNLNSPEPHLPEEPSRDVNNLDIKMARRLFCKRAGWRASERRRRKD